MNALFSEMHVVYKHWNRVVINRGVFVFTKKLLRKKGQKKTDKIMPPAMGGAYEQVVRERLMDRRGRQTVIIAVSVLCGDVRTNYSYLCSADVTLRRLETLLDVTRL